MDYQRLGNSGLLVSPLCLGTMLFGDRTTEAAAGRILALARDAGVNFIDTADQYAKGASEEVLGRLLRRDRNSWVLATKVGSPLAASPNHSGLGRKWMMGQIEQSLRRLGTDWVDIYYLHRPDNGTPIEETLLTIGMIIRSGRARYFGISNYRGWQIAQIVEACDRLAVPRPVVCQPYYNAMNRMPEVEVLPACVHYGLGVAPFSPLARGVLTGKYTPGAWPAANSRAGRRNPRMLATEWRPESLEIAQVIKRHAEARGMTTGQFALLWVLNNRLVASAVVGPRTVAQWRENIRALDRVFTAEDEALIDGLVPPGHPSTPGYNDPDFPPTGRPTRTV